MDVFNSAFGGGLRSGSALADLLQQRQQRSQLQQLAQMAAQPDVDYQQLGAGFIGAGLPGQGMQAMGIPYARQQDALQGQRWQQTFDANEAHRRAQLANEQTRIGIARENAARANQPGLPSGYMWNDPKNPQAGVSMLPGYTPTQGQESWGAPVRTVDEQGNPTLVQFSNRGNQRPIEGYAPGTALQKTDAGNEEVYTNAYTGEIVARVPKDNFGKARDTEAGKQSAKNTAEAQAALPKVEQQTSQALQLVERLRSHPGMDSAMGVVQGRLPSVMASPFGAQQVEDFRAIKDQLTGTAFLQAFESLKGGGQITQIEGDKATAALLAIRDTQSPAEFRKQLDIFEANVKAGLQKARRSASGGTTQSGVQWTVE